MGDTPQAGSDLPNADAQPDQLHGAPLLHSAARLQDIPSTTATTRSLWPSCRPACSAPTPNPSPSAVGADGSVKVADFGLARANQTSDPQPLDRTRALTLARTARDTLAIAGEPQPLAAVEKFLTELTPLSQ